MSEANDSLHSTAYIKVLDLVSEGPIKGLVNGQQSVYFDETPLQNPDGSYNFSDVTFDFRLGTLDQPISPACQRWRTKSPSRPNSSRITRGRIP